MKGIPREVASLLDAVLSGSRERVYVFDAHGMCRYVGPADGSDVSLPGQGMVGHNWRALGLPMEAAEAFRAAFQHVLAGEDSVNGVAHIEVGARLAPYRIRLTAYRDRDTLVIAHLRPGSEPAGRTEPGEMDILPAPLLLEAPSDALLVCEESGCIVSLNRQAERLFGYSREELRGEAAELIVPERHREAFNQRLAACLVSPGTSVRDHAEDFHGMTKGGAEFPARLSFASAATANRCLIICIVRDTERRQSGPFPEDYAQERDLWGTIADTVPAAVFIVTLDDGRIIHSRARTWSLLGYDPDELQGGSLDLFVRGGGDYAMLLEILRVSGGFSDIEVRLRGREGMSLWGLVSGKAFDFRGQSLACLTISDITEVKRLREISYHDSLTGLPNRTALQRTFNRATARADRRGESLALLFIDVDDFKGINDHYGHQVGDIVLQTVARRIEGCVRESDFVARWSGDEFVVFLEGVRGLAEATEVAQKLLAAVSDPVDIGKAETILPGLSIGIASYPEHATDVYRLIERADAAMYEAKRKGKNGYRVA